MLAILKWLCWSTANNLFWLYRWFGEFSHLEISFLFFFFQFSFFKCNNLARLFNVCAQNIAFEQKPGSYFGKGRNKNCCVDKKLFFVLIAMQKWQQLFSDLVSLWKSPVNECDYWVHFDCESVGGLQFSVYVENMDQRASSVWIWFEKLWASKTFPKSTTKWNNSKTPMEWIAESIRIFTSVYYM